MIKGIESFTGYFKDYKEQYILIGGAACDIWLSDQGLTFRITKDLDIVFVMELLNPAFNKKFWEYIKEGGYSSYQKSPGKDGYYRFIKPQNKYVPEMLELFSRRPDFIKPSKDVHIIPISTNSNITSLSAILMDENYYSLIITEKREKGEIPLISIPGLICLKAKACINLKRQKASGIQVDSRDIRKHKNDVLRLTFILTEEDTLAISSSIQADMDEFLHTITSETIDIKVLARNMGVPPIERISVIENLKRLFGIG